MPALEDHTHTALAELIEDSVLIDDEVFRSTGVDFLGLIFCKFIGDDESFGQGLGIGRFFIGWQLRDEVPERICRKQAAGNNSFRELFQ